MTRAYQDAAIDFEARMRNYDIPRQERMRAGYTEFRILTRAAFLALRNASLDNTPYGPTPTDVAAILAQHPLP